MKTIILAEKPSVAREIAHILGVTTKSSDGTYLYNDQYAVTWAFGHIVTLANPEDYTEEWKPWVWETLPMLPNPFQLTISFNYTKIENKLVKKVDDGVKKQLNSIKTLFTNANDIIVATDAGREGELIFRYIYEYLGIRKPFKRLWISSLTKEAIVKGFNNLQAGSKYDNLYFAAFCRAKADWLVGLNATRALTVVAKQTFPMGRVQTPTLCLIIQRYLENKNFVPQKYYQVQLNLEFENQKFLALSENSFESVSIAQRLTDSLNRLSQITAQEVISKERRENPPLLFDLTQLQADCNRKFSLSADDTLKIAQNLYESKVITYPRTSSRYISQDIFAEIPSLIKKVGENIRYLSDSEYHTNWQNAIVYLSQNPLNNTCVNDNKVTDHHALLPTNQHFDTAKFNQQERNVYELIVSRMFESFHQICIKDVTTATFIESSEKFVSKGVVIRQLGWRGVLLETEEKDENEGNLPNFNTGNSISLIKALNLEKFTKAKPLHNEASLLKLMETAGKDIDNEILREAMKENGLGTPATRASIIEGLLSRAYIIRQKKNLIPTDKGLALYGFVKDRKLGKAVLTGEWEYKLAKVEKGELAPEVFMQEIEAYTGETLHEIKTESEVITTAVSDMAQKKENAKPDCPICKKAKMTIYEKGIFCANKESCSFVVWRNQRSRDLTDAQLTELVTKGKTKKLKFKSKEQKEYEAFLLINTKEKKVEFVFDK